MKYYPIGSEILYEGVSLTVVAQKDNKPSCARCYFSQNKQEKRHTRVSCFQHGMACTAHTRKDKKHVIFSESV